ncbi:hypothetical protein BRC92_00870 [Halobacteriales archaeon QS_4_69_31]|nr:MAG: hypothetical protein BRC92_00870 [Halobacteriales archaeon QS_4_69_31]
MSRDDDTRGETDGPGADSGDRAGAGVARETTFDGPRKLHPLTVPYRLAQQAIGPVLFVFFAGVPSLTAMFGPRGGVLALVGVVSLAAAIVGYTVASYRRYEYELTEDTFDIRSGVFSRREREIPLRRAQNVDVSQSLVQRILGIATVGVETAGGGQTEANLQYIGEDDAEALRAAVSRRRRSDSPEPPESELAEEVFAVTERELLALAVVSTDFRLVSLLFFGGSLFGPQAFSFIGEQLFARPDSLLGLILGPVAGVAGVVVLGLLSGLINAARYYGFSLERDDEELRYRRGLFQKYSGTIPLSKVQSLTIRENVLARRLGYAALYIETAGRAGAGGDSGGGSQAAIPLAERERVRELARTIEPADLGGFERPPKRARQRYAARYTTALLVLTGVFYGVSTALEFQSYWWLPLVGLVLVPVAAHLKWANLGYALREDHAVTRTGFWSRQTKVVPYHRVQTTVSSETVFQRRRDLGTVVVDTAGAYSLGGNDAKAVDVDARTADEIREAVPDSLSRSLRRRRGQQDRGTRVDTTHGTDTASGTDAAD